MPCVRFIIMNTLAVTILTFGLLVQGQQPIYQSNPFSRITRNELLSKGYTQAANSFLNNPVPSPESSRNNGAVVFEDQPFSSNEGNSSRAIKTNRKIPLTFFKKLSNESSLEFIFRRYVNNVDVASTNRKKLFLVPKGSTNALVGENNEMIVISDPTHETSSPDGSIMRVAVLSERINTKPQKITQSASCQPESRTVELSVKFDPHIIYIPRCVRLERCGGCCATDILSCEPSQITPVEVLVNKFSYIGDEKTEEMSFIEQESVKMEHHTKCECKCRMKQSDCSSRHVYLEDECQCVCRNRDDHEKCSAQQKKIWDAKTCECSCREIKDCNSGYVFSLRTCECELLPSTLETSVRRGRKRRTQQKLHR